jgi:hypothetical protein
MKRNKKVVEEEIKRGVTESISNCLISATPLSGEQMVHLVGPNVSDSPISVLELSTYRQPKKYTIRDFTICALSQG